MAPRQPSPPASACLAVALVCLASAQTAPDTKLTPREAFYNGGPELSGTSHQGKAQEKGDKGKGKGSPGGRASGGSASAGSGSPGGGTLPGGGQVLT